MYRLSKLISSGQKLFHTSDLAVIWKISNPNTLYTTIKRYVKNGVLFPIHKGFYSIVPIKEIDPFLLGLGFLHRFGYISTETVLTKDGTISQAVYPITIVSGVSEKFSINNQEYIVRKMKDDFLYNSDGLEMINGALTATRQRAISDILYFNPRYHFDKKI